MLASHRLSSSGIMLPSQFSQETTADEELRNAQLERAKKKLKKYQSKKIPSPLSNNVPPSSQPVSSTRGAANLSEPVTHTLRDDPRVTLAGTTSVDPIKTAVSQRYLQHQRTPVAPAPSTPSLRATPPLIPIAAPSTPYLGLSSPYSTNNRISRPSFKLPEQSLDGTLLNSHVEKPPPARSINAIPASSSPTKPAGDHRLVSAIGQSRKSSADIHVRPDLPNTKISVSQDAYHRGDGKNVHNLTLATSPLKNSPDFPSSSISKSPSPTSPMQSSIGKGSAAEHGIRSQDTSGYGETAQAMPSASNHADVFELERRYKTLQHTVTSLIEDKAKLSDDNSRLSGVLEKVKADNTEATLAIQSEVDSLNKEVERLRSLQRSLAAKLDQGEQERQEYEEEAKKNIEMKEKEALDAIKKVHEVETRHRIQVTMINKLLKDNATFRNKLTEAKAATYSSVSSESSLFNAPVPSTLPSASELQQQPALLGDLIYQRTQLQTELAALKEKYDMAEGEIDNLRADLHTAKSRIEDVTADHSKRAAEVAKERFQMETVQKQIKKLNEEMMKEREGWANVLAKYEESTMSLHKQLDDAKSDTEKYQRELSESQDYAQVMERNSKNMAETKERMEKLKVDNHSMVGQLEELRQKVIELSNEKMVELDAANSARFRIKKLEEQLEVGDMYKQELDSLREIMRQREQLQDRKQSTDGASPQPASESDLAHAVGVDPALSDEIDKIARKESTKRKSVTIQTEDIDLQTALPPALSSDRIPADLGPDLGAATSILQFENNRLATRCAELVGQKGDILKEFEQYKQKMEDVKRRAREKRGARKEQEWHADARKRSNAGWIWKGDSEEKHDSVSTEMDAQDREGDETDTLASDWSLSSADETDLVDMDVLDVPTVQEEDHEDDGTSIRPRRAASVPTLPKFLDDHFSDNKKHQHNLADKKPRKSLPDIGRSKPTTKHVVTIDSEGKNETFHDGLVGEVSEKQSDGTNVSVTAPANARKPKRVKVLAQEMRGLRKQVASAQVANEELASRLARELHINELLAHENSQIADYVVLYHAERRALIHQTQKALERARNDKEYTPDHMLGPPPTPVSPIAGRTLPFAQQLGATSERSSSSLSKSEVNTAEQVGNTDINVSSDARGLGTGRTDMGSLTDLADQLASRRRVGGMNIRMEVRQFEPCRGCFHEEFIV